MLCREHERQRRLLEQGKKLATVKLSSSHEAEVSGVEALCSGMEDKLAKKHRFQASAAKEKEETRRGGGEADLILCGGVVGAGGDTRA